MNLKVEKVEGADRWRLLEPVLCPIGYTLVIPAGFTYDFGSVPKWCRWYIDNDTDGMAEASIFHDFLYDSVIKPKHYSTKASADKLFYKLLRYYGMGYFRAQSAYLAVRFFGKGNYV